MMNQPRFLQLIDIHGATTLAAIRSELSAGLMASTPAVSPKYFYDLLGSRLFDAITALPEYYPTRTEAAIMAKHLPLMAQQMPAGCVLIDLGAGSCEKAQLLFDALHTAHYIPVDISVDYLRQTLERLKRQHPHIHMTGVGMDFSSQLSLPEQLMNQIAGMPIVVFYPGSSIGNFSPESAHSLLSQVHHLCKRGATGSGLLIGVDLAKDAEILVPAYDDALGVTASFNLNLLRNINRLLGSIFDVHDWRHVALYNAQESRIEMHLEAKRDVTVSWGTHSRRFERGQRIHTENSYKWTLPGFMALLESAGFDSTKSWTDEKNWFSVLWTQA